MRCIRFYLLLLILSSCGHPDRSENTTDDKPVHIASIPTGKLTPIQLIAFARSLTGVPYKYGSIDPKEGLDCSGFITYVFNHFGIAVPRTSVGFTFVGREIELNNARPGDLVLFTGTDTTTSTVGHMGILVSSPGEEFKFIHCTSGKANGVTETPFSSYYIKRYVKTIRIFPANNSAAASL
ncbi:MAG: hypothetical protein JWP44_3863 [Mucilaginibacter sp.]|nr:hypothetical protein [Mucilaginibacter sp.]